MYKTGCTKTRGMFVSSKYFIGFCFFKNSVQFISLQKNTGNHFTTEMMHVHQPRYHSDLEERSGHSLDSAPAHSFSVKWNFILLWEACSGFCIFRWKSERKKAEKSITSNGCLIICNEIVSILLMMIDGPSDFCHWQLLQHSALTA